MKIPQTFRMKKNLDENIELLLKEKPKTKLRDALDYILLEDISCTDANGKVFERYDELYIAKDIMRKGNKPFYFKPYEAISYFEKQANKSFLPSIALTCNILVRLYENRDNPEINKTLMQYKDYENPGHGWHIQNTIVDWKKRKIIHYPNDKDFPEFSGSVPELGGNENINENKQRTAFKFNPEGFDDVILEKALQNPQFKKYIKNLTGLKKPETLIEIGDYFPKKYFSPITIKILTPPDPETARHTTPIWLGGYNKVFCIYSGFNRNYDFAARRVVS